jgi:hypothetical protein
LARSRRTPGGSVREPQDRSAGGIRRRGPDSRGAQRGGIRPSRVSVAEHEIHREWGPPGTGAGASAAPACPRPPGSSPSPGSSCPPAPPPPARAPRRSALPEKLPRDPGTGAHPRGRSVPPNPMFIRCA